MVTPIYENLSIEDQNELTNSIVNNISSTIFSILELEYQKGRITGDGYVQAFNNAINQILSFTLGSLNSFFDNNLKKQKYEFNESIEDYLIKREEMKNDFLDKQIEEKINDIALKEAMTKSNLKLNASKVEEIFHSMQLKTYLAKTDTFIKNQQLVLTKHKLDEEIKVAKLNILNALVKTQIDAWAIMLSSGYLIDEGGNTIVPDFVTNSSINSISETLENAINKNDNFDISILTDEVINNITYPEKIKCYTYDELKTDLTPCNEENN